MLISVPSRHHLWTAGGSQLNASITHRFSLKSSTGHAPWFIEERVLPDELQLWLLFLCKSSVWWCHSFAGQEYISWWAPCADSGSRARRRACGLAPTPSSANLSAWATSSCSLSGSAPNKCSQISKSFPLIPPEWTVNETPTISTDPSVSSCACGSGAALQPLRQHLDACWRLHNWEERTSFDMERAREKGEVDQTALIWHTWETKEKNRKWKRETSSQVFDVSFLRRSLPQDKQIKLPQPRNTFHSADLAISSFILFYVMIVLHCAPFTCAEFKQLKSN